MRSWSKSEKIGIITLIVTVIATITPIFIPEIRGKIGLDPTKTASSEPSVISSGTVPESVSTPFIFPNELYSSTATPSKILLPTFTPSLVPVTTLTSIFAYTPASTMQSEIITRENVFKLKEIIIFECGNDGPALLSKDNRYLVCNMIDPNGQYPVIGIWDFNTQNLLDYIEGGYNHSSHDVHSMMFSPRGDKFAIATGSFVSIWDTTNWNLLRKISGRFDEVGLIAFNPNGTILAATGVGSQNVQLWEIETGKEIAVFEVRSNIDSINDVIFTSEGDQVIVTARDTTVYTIETGNKFLKFEDLLSVTNLALSPDGSLLIFRTSDSYGNYIAKYQINKNQLGYIVGVSGSIVSLALNLDGNIIASASVGPRGAVQIWETNTGRLLTSLYHDDSVYSAVFSSDGRTLVTSTSNGKVHIWQVR